MIIKLFLVTKCFTLDPDPEVSDPDPIACDPDLTYHITIYVGTDQQETAHSCTLFQVSFIGDI